MQHRQQQCSLEDAIGTQRRRSYSSLGGTGGLLKWLAFEMVVLLIGGKMGGIP